MLESLKKISYSKSKTFLAFCFLGMFGAAAASFARTAQFLFPLFVGAVVTGVCVAVCWPYQNARFIAACLLCVLLGAVRFLITFPEKDSRHLVSYNGLPVTVEGYVSEEPAVHIGETEYVIDVQKVTIDQNDRVVKGRMTFKNRSYPAFQYGDRLRVHCSLERPFVSQKGKFRYDTYLARQDIWSVCQNPSVTREAGRSGNFLLHVILEFKLRVNEQLAKLWNEPQASFMAGLLYGSRSSLPQSLTDNFSRTGVSHIIAVSGFNITIIGTVLGTLFVALGISRKKAFWWILGIIFLFVLFSGASSSVVRAGIMGSLVLVARRLGRMSRIGNVLIGTAALMTLLNPYVLVWDVGFQLSFLATIGLVYISPLFEKIVPTVKSPDWLIGLSETLLATLSAIIATLPLILFQFGRLSIVAPLVNVLVLWAVPWLMLLGFLALLLSCLYFPLGQGVAWLAAVGLKYVILVVSFFGSKSWAALDIQLPWWGMGVLYLGLIVVVAREQGKEDGHVELDNSKKV